MMNIFEMSAPEMTVPVTVGPTLSNGVKTIIGSIPVAYIASNFEIPRRDTVKKIGYQRDVSQSRVNKLKSDLSKGQVDLPTAVLVNVRNTTLEAITYQEGGAVYLKGPSKWDSGKFYIVDGQHRILALSELREQEPEKWAKFTIPFVAMVGATERQEMEQFYVVNTNAKSVRTDLAYDLLKQRAETDPTFMQSLIERGDDWKVKGEAIVEALAKSSPVWKHRIRFPNAGKAETTISSSSMVSSLRPILHAPYFEALELSDQIKILDAYWRGIREVLPDAWGLDPQGYTIQKGIGVTVLHNVLIVVLEHIRTKGLSVTESASYCAILKEPLLKLQGDNQRSDPVEGSDFWRVAPLGAAGQYSSSAGQRVLIAKIKSNFPKMGIE